VPAGPARRGPVPARPAAPPACSPGEGHPTAEGAGEDGSSSSSRGSHGWRLKREGEGKRTPPSLCHGHPRGRRPPSSDPARPAALPHAAGPLHARMPAAPPHAATPKRPSRGSPAAPRRLAAAPHRRGRWPAAVPLHPAAARPRARRHGHAARARRPCAMGGGGRREAPEPNAAAALARPPAMAPRGGGGRRRRGGAARSRGAAGPPAPPRSGRSACAERERRPANTGEEEKKCILCWRKGILGG